MKQIFAVVVFLIGAGSIPVQASTIDFEQYAAGTAITNQYAGEVFSGGAVEETSASIAALIQYTPQSGTGFVANVMAPTILVTFSSVQSAISGYYMSYQGMTLTAYDLNGALLSTQTLAPNLGINTLWVMGGGGIASVYFTAPTGTFALDDISYTSATPVPEPLPLMMLGTGLCIGSVICVYKASRAKRDSADADLCGQSCA